METPADRAHWEFVRALHDQPGTEPAWPAQLVGIEQEFEFFEQGRQRDFRRYIHPIAAAGETGTLRVGPFAYQLRDGLLVTCDGWEAEIATPPELLAPGTLSRLPGLTAHYHRRLFGLLGNWANGAGTRLGLRGYSTHFNAYCAHVDIDRLCALYARSFAPAMMLMSDLPSSPGLLVRPRARRFEVGCEYIPPTEHLAAAATFFVGSFLAAWQALSNDALETIPVWFDARAVERPRQRYGYYVDRRAFGEDLYARGRKAILATERGRKLAAQEVLERCWAVAKPALNAVASKAEIALAEQFVQGRRKLPLELRHADAYLRRRARARRPAGRYAREFGPRLAPFSLGAFRVEPHVVTWDYVVFRATGKTRPVYVNVPRRYLGAFTAPGAREDALAAILERYLATEVSPRKLASTETAESPGLFDEVATTELQSAGSSAKKKKKPPPGHKEEGCSVVQIEEETPQRPPIVKLCVPATRDALELDPSKPQEPPLNATAEAMGVFVHSGAFMHSQADLAVKAPGFGVAFTRHYRSAIRYDGLLGHGWDHAYNQRVVPTRPAIAEVKDFGWCEIYDGPDTSKSGDLWLYDGTGRRTFHAFASWHHRTLRRSQDGQLREFKAVVTTYRMNPGERFEIERVAVYDGPLIWGEPIYYVLRSYDGSEHIFNCHGYVIAIRDANRNTMRFAYGLPINPGTGYKTLASMQDTAKRSYSFAYKRIAGQLRLVGVTDPWSRQVSFTYSGRGELQQVSAPGGQHARHLRAYRYRGRAGLLTEVVAPNEAPGGPSVIENTYNAEEQVVKQRVGTPPGVTPAAGGVYEFDYQGGRVGSMKDRCGETTSFQHRPLHDAAVVSRVALANRQKTIPGFSYTEPAEYVTVMEYDEHFQITRVTRPRGDREEFDYETRNAPLTIGDELDWIERGATVLNDLARGNLLEHRHVSPVAGEGVATVRREYERRFNRVVRKETPLGATTYVYDNGWSARPRYNGNPLRIMHPFARRPDGGVVNMLDTFDYGEHGLIAEHTEPSGMRTTFTYHESGEVEEIVADADNLALTSTITRDPRGNPLEIRDAKNRTTLQKFDDRDNLVEVTDALGHGRSYTFDSNDRATEISVQVADDAGFVQPPQPARTLVTRIEFDLLGQTVAIAVDPDGLNLREETEYDGEGRVVAERTARAAGAAPEEPNAIIRKEYDSRGRLFAEIAAPGHRDEKREYYGYDENGNLRFRIAATGGLWTYLHDGFDRLVQWTDPVGTRQHIERNGAGQAVKIEVHGALGGPSPTDRSGAGNVLLARTVQEFDAYDRIIRTAAAKFSPGAGPAMGQESVVHSTFFDAAGNVEHTLDPDGHRTHYEYDTAGRLTKVTGPGGHYVHYERDPAGNVVVETRHDAVEGQPQLGRPRALELRVRRAYDALDRLVREEVPGAGVTEFCWDSLGNLRGTRRDGGAASVSRYDLAGREIETSDPAQDSPYNPGGRISTRWKYNANGFPVEITDGLGQVTTHVFDPLDRLREVRDAAGGASVALEMDGEGRPLLVRNRAGAEIRYQYDATGRMTRRRHQNPAAQPLEQAFEYDGADQITRATSNDRGGSVVVRRYNSLGWLDSESQDSFDVSYFYGDNSGRVGGITYPSLGDVAMAWSGSGRLQSIDRLGERLATYSYLGPRTLERVVELGLDPGTGASLRFPLIKRQRFNAEGQLRTFNHYVQDNVVNPGAPVLLPLVQASGIDYDRRGRIERITYDDRTVTYRYDESDRLVHEVADDIRDGSGIRRRGTLKQLDAAGNLRRTDATVQPVVGRGIAIVSQTTYDRTNFPISRTTSVDGGAPVTQAITNRVSQGLIETPHVIQAPGLPTLRTTRSLFLDAFGRLSFARVGIWRLWYQYDAFGRRIGHVRETLDAAGAVVGYEETRYVFWEDRCIEEWVRSSESAAFQVARRFYHGGGVNEVVALDVQQSIAGDVDNDGRTDGLATLVFLDDRDGTPLGLARHRYSGTRFPFLFERYSTDSEGRHQVLAISPQGQVQVVPFSQARHGVHHHARWYHDLEGLHYNTRRFFDPNLGQFITPDPGGAWHDPFALGNAYLYAGRNPSQRIDPAGELAWDIVDLGFVVLGAVMLIRDPSWENLGMFALDLVAALPGIPAVHRYAQASAAAFRFFVHARQVNRLLSTHQSVGGSLSEFERATRDDPALCFEDRAYHVGKGAVLAVFGLVGAREGARDGLYYFPALGRRAGVVNDIRFAKSMVTATTVARRNLPPDTPTVPAKTAVNRWKEMKGEIATLRGMELIGYRATGIPMGYRLTRFGWHMNGIDGTFERGGFLRTRYAVAEAKFSEAGNPRKFTVFGLSHAERAQRGMPAFPAGGVIQGYSIWNTNRLWLALLDRNATPETIRLARHLIGLASQGKLPAYVGYFQAVNEKRHGLWRLAGEGAGPFENLTRHIPSLRH